MKKIEINLCPYQSGEERKYAKFIDQYFPAVFLAVIILVFVNCAMIMFGGLTHLPYSSLKKKWEDVTPKVRALAALEKEIEDLTKGRDAYKKMLSRQVNISRLMASLYKSLPKNVWLEQISYDKSLFKITGYVAEWQQEGYLMSLDKFIKTLQKDDYFPLVFKYIESKGQKKISISGKEVMRFDLECRS